jgi:hypothetical protein
VPTTQPVTDLESFAGDELARLAEAVRRLAAAIAELQRRLDDDGTIP